MYTWKVNIKIAIKELGYKHMDWIQLALSRAHWQALVGTIIDTFRKGTFNL
jgi:hypothetical protein